MNAPNEIVRVIDGSVASAPETRAVARCAQEDQSCRGPSGRVYARAQGSAGGEVPGVPTVTTDGNRPSQMKLGRDVVHGRSHGEFFPGGPEQPAERRFCVPKIPKMPKIKKPNAIERVSGGIFGNHQMPKMPKIRNGKNETTPRLHGRRAGRSNARHPR